MYLLSYRKTTKKFSINSLCFDISLYFEETRNILVNQMVNYENISQALCLNIFYLVTAITVFYYSFDKDRDKGALINIRE